MLSYKSNKVNHNRFPTVREINSIDKIYKVRKRSLHAEGEDKTMSSPGDHKIVHTYERPENGRKSIVMEDPTEGLYVILCHNGLRVDKITCYDKSERWAENVAENYVDGILNP